jgi:hypothetical protein
VKWFFVAAFFLLADAHAQDVTYTYTISGLSAIPATTFQDTTASAGFSAFPAGATLKSMTLAITSFASTLPPPRDTYVSDMAVAVAPTTPTATNATFYTTNTGGFFSSGITQAWAGNPPRPSVSTNTMTVSSTVSLSGLKLYVGNAYTQSGTWAGTLTVVYDDGVTPTAQAVPTLSEWSQMLLGLMVLTMIGWQWRKQQSAGH